MGEHANPSFFIFLAILLFFLLSSSGKKKKQQEKREPLSRLPPLKTSTSFKEKPLSPSFRTPKEAPNYQVHKVKDPILLQKGWKKKKSLKQAFILSEVLRRVDERERKF